MSSKLIVVTGGARSGKSLFAERLAEKKGGRIAYIATAQIYDEEMGERVKLHRQRRPAEWQTFEAPFDAHEIIENFGGSTDVILFDCLTLYTTNLLLQPGSSEYSEEKLEYILLQIDKLLAASRASSADVILVTNEVGLGIVPDNALARRYRDIAGLVNQRAAAAADQVYLTVSGLAVELKKISVNLSEV